VEFTLSIQSSKLFRQAINSEVRLGICLLTEETIVRTDENSEHPIENGEVATALGERDGIKYAGIKGLGKLSPHETARKLAAAYFRNWHPLFRFLSGQHFFGKQMELVYEEQARLWHRA
jgi:hypothetical protein